ncbi:hypothetical protein ACFYM2_26950 [Streptomyces sp. NPDC006711]|uniref:hypothetical protein n=1 Tax=unclassified Streptomyces TaxID=2593676 RepID=UPI00341034BB
MPQRVAGVKAARVHYEASRAMSTERRALNLLRWFGLDKGTAGQLRSRTMAHSMLDRFRTIGGPVDAAADKAVHLLLGTWHARGRARGRRGVGRAGLAARAGCR